MTDPHVKAYQVLGIRPNSDADTIRTAYHDLVKVWHPDRFPGDPELQLKAQEKLKEITAAYNVLKDGSYRTTVVDRETDQSASANYNTATKTSTNEAEDENRRVSWIAIVRWTTLLPVSIAVSIIVFNIIFFTLAMPVVKATNDLPYWYKVFATTLGRFATGYVFVWFGSLMAPYRKRITAAVLFLSLVIFQGYVAVPILTSGESRYYLFIAAMVLGALLSVSRILFRRKKK